MNNKDVYILGVGNNTPVIIEIAELCGYTVKGLYNYTIECNLEEYALGYPIIGTYDDLFDRESLKSKNFVLSMGNNKIRKELFDRVISNGGTIPTLIHPTASVSKYATIDQCGVIIQANSTVQANVSIGSNSVVSFNVGVTHSTTIGKHCYVAVQAIVGAYCTIGEGAFIGMGSVIVSAKVHDIGSWAIIGAGAVVLNSVSAGDVVYGNPARSKSDEPHI